MDLRLKTLSLEWEGKTYELCCNMNVLAEVQEMNGGTIAGALRKPIASSGLQFLAAMLNDYADSQGWPERFEAKAIGRKLPISAVDGVLTDVMGLVVASLSGDGTTEDAEKNG